MADVNTLVPEEILTRIREEVQRSKNVSAPPTWKPPVARDFRPTQILSFDQSLSHAGWALINTEDNEITVVESGTIRSPKLGDVRGFEATLTKALLLGQEIQILLDRQIGCYESVVVELPSVAGYRTESSLVALVIITLEMDRAEAGRPILVSRNSAAAHLCGDRNVSKRVSSEFVDQIVTEHPTGTGQWTEHVRDAVFVGLRYLLEQQ